MGKSKGTKGTCNICGEKDVKLSFDHVPPQCVQESLKVEYSNIFGFKKEPHYKKSRVSQKGIGFKTICEKCNNELGKKYDRSVQDLVVEIVPYLDLEPFPAIIKVNCCPLSIMKSVAGHLLAAKSYTSNSIIDQKLKAFLLGESDVGLYFHYWYHPYKHTRVFRDFLIPRVRGVYTHGDPKDTFGVFSLLQFYPISFLVTNFPEYDNLSNLNAYLNLQDEDSENITLELYRTFGEHYPDFGNPIVMGKSAYDSIYSIGRN